jgi:hypothetical protein
MEKINLLLPWYINETLSESEKIAVQDLVDQNPDSFEDYQFTQQISKILQAQDSLVPSNRVKNHLLNIIHNQPIRSKKTGHAWLWGVPMTIIIFIILWLVAQPGTLLQWSIHGISPEAFLIYRAPEGSQQFVLIDELSATPLQPDYQYADILVMPGQTYHYLIEVRDQYGNTIKSHATTNDSQMALAAQIALFLTSFIIAIGIIKVIQEINTFPKLHFTF